MIKPFLLTVDDDPSVLRAVERDLRNKYAANYRILRAESGKEALELLAQLIERKEDVALILADQRMPEMDGVQFLAKARELFPDARRVLLTAYADTNAAISAINDVRLHHYLMKPWDPPETNLYPVLDDLLSDWLAEYSPPFRGIKVVGQRWNPEALRIKDFLGCHHVQFRWVDVMETANDDTLCDFLTEKRKLLFIVFPDGSCADCPDSEALASKLELHTKADTQAYDLVIGGGGPAGLAVAQARKFGVEILAPRECVKLRTDDAYHILTLADGMDRLTGAGIYYGSATTEAPSCKDQDVYVIGGANSAGQAAMHFSHFARKVTMLVRGDGLSATMSKYLIDQIEATHNIEVRPHSEVVAVEGAEHLESMTIRNRQLSNEESVAAQLLFIFIDARPCTGWLKATLCLDEHGFVRTGPSLSKNGQHPQRWLLPRDPMLLETLIPGVFAADDTRSGSVKRVASSVGEGSVVVQFVHQFLRGH